MKMNVMRITKTAVCCFLCVFIHQPLLAYPPIPGCQPANSVACCLKHKNARLSEYMSGYEATIQAMLNSYPGINTIVQCREDPTCNADYQDRQKSHQYYLMLINFDHKQCLNKVQGGKAKKGMFGNIYYEEPKKSKQSR